MTFPAIRLPPGAVRERNKLATGKDPEGCKRPLRFEAASAAKQHPFKEQQQYIYADAVCCAQKWLGVCDGVSGVQKMGIAPDLLPRELLAQCQKVMSSSPDMHMNGENGSWVLSVLKKAFAGTSSLGATTVLLAGIEDCQRLAVVTLGDCAMILLRPTSGDNLRSTFRSQRVMMGEKTPAQVLRLPHQVTGEQKELVEDFRLDTVQIKHGDVLVLGSDGLFDNLSDEAITNIVQRHCTQCSFDEQGHASARSRSRPLVQQLPVLYKGRPVPSVLQLQQAAASLVDAAIQNVILVADQPAAMPLVARGNPDDTTAIVAVVVEEGRNTDSDSEIELHDVYPDAEAMLNKVACPDQRVCSAGIWPVCCYAAAIDRDDNEDSEAEVSSDHPDTEHGQVPSCCIS